MIALLVSTVGTARAGDEKPKWDVQSPPGPSSKVAIDTRRGTWMSVDTSPDGADIVFDLLGDLYCVPITGGEARSLTSGVSWDMQPTYAPDGAHIAFTSDRGGGDNIWIARRDGSDPKPVSKESFRLLSSPAWSPDGRFLVGRKHFTSRRSLGAGELWLYHWDGGSGLQLTERPNDQKDLGEPAFSPDGRWIYFSRDVTPGKVFEYNKDPHAGIYAIERLELASGRRERVIGGAGGAIRPTPSPDGKRLAFIRRVGVRTVLHVMDLETRGVRPLFDGLDRDLQEAWAIHGVYSTMAWTRDSKAVIAWARGRLYRVDAATGTAAEIPFHVRTERAIQPAVRYPVEVAPPRVDVRTLRGVAVSPAGDAVAYQALGVLYVRPLPDGAPRRLTKQSTHFEAMPAWSRDGKRIAYVAWNDDELGQVRVVSSRGGRGKSVTASPGMYVTPAFSPDGKTLVYRKAQGGWLVSANGSADPGIYRIPAAGGAPTLLSRVGKDPHFGARGDRVYLTERGKEQKVLLGSVGWHGQEKRLHLRAEAAHRFRVAPDGGHVAFGQQFRAYALPFTPTGRIVDVGAKFDGVPLVKASTDTAFSLHWAHDSKRIYWVRGAELMHRDLDGGEPPKAGRGIGFQAPAAVPDGVTAVVGAKIVTMKDDEVIADGTVVVRGDRIEAVGARGDVKVPEGAHRIDGAGLVVIPGLMDVHAHGAHVENGLTPQRNWGLYGHLAFGVTTLHDPSHDTLSIFSSSELQRAGRIVAPRIFSTGTILYGAAGPLTAPVESLEDAQAHMRRLKAVGAFSVKSYNQPRRDQRQQVLTAAREWKMMVVPEGGSLFQHNMNQVVDGHTGIEHAIPLADAYDDVLQLWAGTRVGYTPTLTVAYGGLMGEWYWYQHTRVWAHPRLTRFVPRFALDPKARRRKMVEDDDWNHVRAARLAKKLMDAGVKVQIGGHGQREGLGVHWEMWSLAQGGATPLEVIRAATLHGAQYLGLDGDLGSIQPGKLADLAILNRDPLADIRNSEHVKYVMVGGWIYDAATMDRVGVHPKKRGRFHFEK